MQMARTLIARSVNTSYLIDTLLSGNTHCRRRNVVSCGTSKHLYRGSACNIQALKTIHTFTKVHRASVWTRVLYLWVKLCRRWRKFDLIWFLALELKIPRWPVVKVRGPWGSAPFSGLSPLLLIKKSVILCIKCAKFPPPSTPPSHDPTRTGHFNYCRWHIDRQTRQLLGVNHVAGGQHRGWDTVPDRTTVVRQLAALPRRSDSSRSLSAPPFPSALCGLRELWFFVRIRPIRFLAGCRKRRLNQG